MRVRVRVCVHVCARVRACVCACVCVSLVDPPCLVRDNCALTLRLPLDVSPIQNTHSYRNLVVKGY